MSLADALPLPTDPAGRRWLAAIRSALKATVRHTRPCSDEAYALNRKNPRPVARFHPDCPWCEHILTHLRTAS